MTTVPSLRTWKFVFAATAVWTLLGAVPGFVDPLGSFVRFQGGPPASDLELQLYRGAWGQTLLFAVGYVFAAFDPRRHVLLLVLGGVGKLLYAARILVGGDAAPLALFAAVGDLVFVAAIATFMARDPGARSLFRLGVGGPSGGEREAGAP
jgi:hypothetical protein